MQNLAYGFDSQGHRGTRGLAPENTLVAFAKALSIGVTTLELDVAATRDGIIVVSHDPRLNPSLTRDAYGDWIDEPGPAIRSLRLDDLKTYDVGRSKPGSRYAGRYPDQVPVDGTHIPTLQEVFQLVRRSGNETVRFNIETKLQPGQPDLFLNPEEFVASVMDVIVEQGFLNRVTIQSFDWRTLQETQRTVPNVPTSYLSAQQNWLDNIGVGKPGPSAWTAGYDIDDYDGSVPQLIQAAGGSIWSSFHLEVSSAKIKQAHDLGLEVKVWTVNDEARMEALIGMGVDGIITDYPDRLRAVLERLGMAIPTPTPVSP